MFNARLALCVAMMVTPMIFLGSVGEKQVTKLILEEHKKRKLMFLVDKGIIFDGYNMNQYDYNNQKNRSFIVDCNVRQQQKKPYIDVKIETVYKMICHQVFHDKKIIESGVPLPNNYDLIASITVTPIPHSTTASVEIDVQCNGLPQYVFALKEGSALKGFRK